MSDIEEPASKMSKYEEYLEDEEEECMDEGQEEWLSEGVLTDDDNPMNKTNSHNDTTQDQDTMCTDQTIPDSTQTEDTDQNPDQTGDIGENREDRNIEDTLNSLDNTEKDGEDDLDDYLIKIKQDNEMDKNAKVEENGNIEKHEADDGNDTDDLLRMLGEGDQKKKKLLKMKSSKKAAQDSSDDDEIVYEKSQVRTLKVATTALQRRVAPKAEPEDMSDDQDGSSDDATTVHKMFQMPNTQQKNKEQLIAEKRREIEASRRRHEEISRVARRRQEEESRVARRRQEEVSRVVRRKQEERRRLNVTERSVKIAASVLGNKEFKVHPMKATPKSILKTPNKNKPETPKRVVINDEVIDDEEYLDDGEFDLDEQEFGSDCESEQKQRLMRPERMDEEAPSDDESDSEDGSLYDELPSSDSEDIDDWFNLDIRSERASDYLPLLGSKAKEVLLSERRRVTARVNTLRQSLSALTDSARKQADALRTAAMCLAEVDDTLRAA